MTKSAWEKRSSSIIFMSKNGKLAQFFLGLDRLPISPEKLNTCYLKNRPCTVRLHNKSVKERFEKGVQNKIKEGSKINLISPNKNFHNIQKCQEKEQYRFKINYNKCTVAFERSNHTHQIRFSTAVRKMTIKGFSNAV